MITLRERKLLDAELPVLSIEIRRTVKKILAESDSKANVAIVDLPSEE